MSITKPCGLNYNDVDTYILLINKKDFTSYSFAHFFEVGYKRGQPIHPVCIGAPINFDIDENDGKYNDDDEYYNQVRTYAITHELGHALARLQDEYVSNNVPSIFSIYFPGYRNIDNDTDYKWQKMIDIGYGGGTEWNNLVDGFIGGLYSTNYFRPTYSTTMGDYNLIDRQFGPINTYHLEATFKARTSPVDLKVDDSLIKIFSEPTEWSHYPIEQFYNDWSPEQF